MLLSISGLGEITSLPHTAFQSYHTNLSVFQLGSSMALEALQESLVLDSHTSAALDLLYSSDRLTRSELRANYTGDIVLAAVFPIHENQNYSCGVLQVSLPIHCSCPLSYLLFILQEESLLELEALAFTLKRINADPDVSLF